MSLVARRAYGKRKFASAARATPSVNYSRAYAGGAGVRRSFRPYRKAAKRFYRATSHTAGASAAGRLVVKRIAAAVENTYSPCVDKWLALVMDPFEGPADACNPFLPPVYSERIRVFARYNVNLNDLDSTTQPNQGVAILQAGPGNDNAFMLFSGDTTTNWTVNSRFVDYCGAAAGGTSVQNNSPFVNTNFQDGTNYFGIVGMGLRVRYIGSSDAMGGMIGIWEPEGHQAAAASSMSLTNMVKSTKFRWHPVSREPVCVLWTGPQRPAEFEYGPTGTLIAGQVSNSGNNESVSLIMYLQGTGQTGGDQFLFEGFYTYEVTGALARGIQFSEADAKGAAKAQQNLLKAGKGMTIGGTASSMGIIARQARGRSAGYNPARPLPDTFSYDPRLDERSYVPQWAQKEMGQWLVNQLPDIPFIE